MALAANLIIALSARNGLCVAGSGPFRKHIAIVGSTNHLCSSKSCEFEQIMGRADQHPFLFDLVQPAQQELPEPACLLDLPKHRLDRLLAQPIRAVIALAGNLLGHGGEPAALLGFPRSRRRGAVLLPAGRDKPVDLTFLQTLQIGVRGVATPLRPSPYPRRWSAIACST